MSHLYEIPDTAAAIAALNAAHANRLIPLDEE